MKTIIIGLKTDIISAHPIYPVGSIKDIIYLNLENPTVELSEEDANLVLIGANGNVFQIVGESETPDLTKEQLQALFLQISTGSRILHLSNGSTRELSAGLLHLSTEATGHLHRIAFSLSHNSLIERA